MEEVSVESWVEAICEFEVKWLFINTSKHDAIEYTDSDILPALPETMSIRDRRLFSYSISDPRSREIMTGYPSFYDITPHPC